MEIEDTKKGVKSPLKLREDFDASSLHGLDHPAVVPLVPDTGKKCEPVIAGGGGTAGVGLLHLLDADHLISPCAQLGGPGDGVARFQGVELPEVVVHAAVVRGDAAVSIPQAGVLEVARALG